MKLWTSLLTLSTFALVPSAFGINLSKDSTTDEKLFSVSSLNKAGGFSQGRSLQSLADQIKEGVNELKGYCASTGWTDFESTGKTCPQHLCTVPPFSASSCCSEIDLQVTEETFTTCLGAEQRLAANIDPNANLATNRGTYCGLVAPEDTCCDLPNNVGLFSLCLVASPDPFYSQLIPGILATTQGLEANQNGMSDTCFNSYLGVLGKRLAAELFELLGVDRDGGIRNQSDQICETNGDSMYSGLMNTVQSVGDYEWTASQALRAGLFYGYCNNDCFDADFYKAASKIGLSYYLAINAAVTSALPETNYAEYVDVVGFVQAERKCAHSLEFPLESVRNRFDTCTTGGDFIENDDSIMTYDSCTNFRTIEFSAESAKGKKRKKSIKRSFCVDSCGIDDDSELPLSEEDFLFMAKQNYVQTQLEFKFARGTNLSEEGDPHPLGNLCKDDIIKAEFVETTKCHPAKMGRAYDKNEQCGTTKYIKAPKSTKAPKGSKAPKSTKAPKESKAPKSTKAPKESKAPKSTKAPKESKAPKSTKAPKESKAPKGTKAPKESKAPKTPKVSKAPKTPKVSKAPKEN